MVKIYLTEHGKLRLKQCFGVREDRMEKFAEKVWTTGRLPTEFGSKRLFNLGLKRHGRPWMAEYRVYNFHMFVFMNQNGRLKFITVYKMNFEWVG